MGLLFSWRGRQIDDQAVLRAKQDSLARGDLIAAHRDWLLRVVARACRRYVSAQDDEFSVGLMAFDEAITAFRADRSAAFSTFAEQVIRRRLIDWQRKEQQRPELAWSGLQIADDDTPIAEQVTTSASLVAFQLSQESDDRRREIEQLTDELSVYGISFSELVQVSPRHRDARESAKQVARTLAGSVELLAKLRQSKGLPLKELEQVATVSRKTLERQRKYIIALTLVLTGDYPLVRSFVEWPKGGDGRGQA